MTQHYLGFTASPALATEARLLISRRDAKASPKELHAILERVVNLFVPECLNSFLVECCNVIGLSPMAMKVVNGGVDTINGACTLLISQLMKKRTDDEILAMVDFVDNIFVPADRVSTGKDSVGAKVSESQFNEMKHITREIQAGRAAEVTEALHRLMIEVADIIQDRLMHEPIKVLNLGFVMRKMTDGAFATTKGASHMVVNRVFKKLSDNELLRMSSYFDALLITA
jgi:hypothetical protein